MGVSIEEYRQRIGCFVRVLSSFKVRGNNNTTFQKQSKDFGTALRVIIRLGCLVLLVAAVIQSSSSVLDLTQFGDVEKNPGPNTVGVNDLHPLLRQRICKILDIRSPIGGDYRALAAYFHMSYNDIRIISQNPDPTDNVLQWVGRNPKNTIAKLREVLQDMEREDCVMIIDEDPRRSTKIIDIHSAPETENDLIEQDLSEFKKFIKNKIFDRIPSREHIHVFPELLTMESLYLSTETLSTNVRSVTLLPVGELKESLDDLDKGFMRRFEHFTWLNSQQSSLSSAAATTLAKMLPSFELLEELDLSDAGLDEVDVEKVLKALKSCKLKILGLDNNTVGAKGATTLARMLPSFELLEELYLLDASLDEVDVEKVLKALKSCKKLKLLNLGNNTVAAKGATTLAKMLPSFELLEVLYLSNAGLNEVDVEKVLKALKSCKLKILYLNNNTVGAEGATALAKMLPSLELLEVLYLSDAGLNEVDVEKVLKALKSCKKLKILDLNNNTIGAKGATALVEMLPSFLCLKLLNLRNVSLDEEVKTKLRATRTVSKILF